MGRFATAEPNYALYLITAPTAAEVAKRFRQLIGPSYIPPKWAFGLAQSRFGYKTAEDVREVARQYKENDLPLDMICMDIDYMQDYADFTINKERFPDLAALAAELKAQGIRLVVDNTFGTPYLIRPIEHGADIVVHSATKFLGGHGTTLGGIIVDSGKFDWAASGKYPAIAEPNPSYHGVSFVAAAGPAAFVTYIRAVLLRDTGATISPFAAFLLLQGVETLSLRLERHAENTRKVVEFLANHPQVEHVNHPSLPNHPDHALYEKYFPNGGGSIFTFEIKGGVKEAHKFIDNLKIFSLLANVADVKSLVIHPATTTHSQLTEEELLDQGIKPNTIRLSIGTEHIDDILADLQRGFDAVKEG